MATEVEIANSAIAKVRGRKILTLDDDTVEGRLVKILYPAKRDQLLRSHLWNFAIRRESLARDVETPAYEYDYQFTLPSDCLRVIETDLPENADWAKEGNKILCNELTLNARILWKQTDASQYDSVFSELLAYKIAEELAYPLAQSASLLAEIQKKILKFEAEARSFDAQESGSVKQISTSTWLNARF